MSSPTLAMSPEAYVDALYRICLGRPAEAEGKESWAGYLRSTGDATSVLQGILESAEYQNRLPAPALPPHLSEAQRVEMTVSCRDADTIPKVPGAGEIFFDTQQARLQRMHNGLFVVAGGYYGDWMSEIIRRLRGHHEPQEELLFHAMLSALPSIDATPVMIEPGACWSYYSLWFHSVYPTARNILVEPDPHYLRVGETNFALNHFACEPIQASIGNHGHSLDFLCESDGVTRSIPSVSIDGLVSDLQLERIHLLHVDIQGAELLALNGALQTIEKGLLKWLFLSTHHHSISRDPLTHQRCLSWLRDHGANIVEEHSISESFSGDGLIVANFSERPSLTVGSISRNRASSTLFRETEYDLSQAWASNALGVL